MRIPTTRRRRRKTQNTPNTHISLPATRPTTRTCSALIVSLCFSSDCTGAQGAATILATTLHRPLSPYLASRNSPDDEPGAPLHRFFAAWGAGLIPPSQQGRGMRTFEDYWTGVRLCKRPGMRPWCKLHPTTLARSAAEALKKDNCK